MKQINLETDSVADLYAAALAEQESAMQLQAQMMQALNNVAVIKTAIQKRKDMENKNDNLHSKSKSKS